MKKDVLIIILLILASALVFVFICLPSNQIEIKAVDGVLDLRGVDLSDKSFKLSGEWLVSFNDGEKTAVSFPHKQSLFDLFGYGVGDKETCTLTVLTDADVPFEIFIPEVDDSCEVRVNGETVFSTESVQIAFANGKL